MMEMKGYSTLAYRGHMAKVEEVRDVVSLLCKNKGLSAAYVSYLILTRSLGVHHRKVPVKIQRRLA